MTPNRKDVAAGAFFVLVGLFYAVTTWRSLPIGSGLSIGPGYFPLILSIVLAALGLATLGRGLVMGGDTPFGVIPWRALVMLTLATVVFATFLSDLGLFPAVFLSCAIAALSSPQVRLLPALLISFLIAAFCVIVFVYGIRLPVPIFGPWLTGGG